MSDLIQSLLGSDDGSEYAMTKVEKENLDKSLDSEATAELQWKPNREATELAIRDMILRHPTEFEQLLKKHHEASGLEFKSSWLDKVKALQIA